MAIKKLAIPATVGLEFYSIDGGHEFGARVVLPEGRTHADYTKANPEDNIQVSAMEVVLGHALAIIATDEHCVEVIDFNGVKSECKDYTVEKVMAKMLTDIVAEAAEDRYKELVSEGVVPKSMSFETWFELEMAEASGESGGIH